MAAQSKLLPPRVETPSPTPSSPLPLLSQMSVEQPLFQRTKIRNFILSLLGCPKQYTIEEPATFETLPEYDQEAHDREQERMDERVASLRQDPDRETEYLREVSLQIIKLKKNCVEHLFREMGYEESYAELQTTLNPRQPTDNKPLFVFNGERRHVNKELINRALRDFKTIIQDYDEKIVGLLDRNPFPSLPVLDTLITLMGWVEKCEASDDDFHSIPIDGSLLFVPSTEMELKYGIYCTVIKYLWNNKKHELAVIGRELDKEAARKTMEIKIVEMEREMAKLQIDEVEMEEEDWVEEEEGGDLDEEEEAVEERQEIEQSLHKRIEIRNFLLSLLPPKQYTVEEPVALEPIWHWDQELLAMGKHRFDEFIKRLKSQNLFHPELMYLTSLQMKKFRIKTICSSIIRDEETSRIVNRLEEPITNYPLFFFNGERNHATQSKEEIKKALEVFVNLIKGYEGQVGSSSDTDLSSLPVPESIEALRVWIEQWEASEPHTCPIPIRGAIHFVPTTPQEFEYGLYCNVIKYLWNNKKQQIAQVEKDLERKEVEKLEEITQLFWKEETALKEILEKFEMEEVQRAVEEETDKKSDPSTSSGSALTSRRLE